MANVLKTPSQKAQIGYNGFDMSMLNKFSSTTGELLPVYYDLLYPGDKVTMSSLLRTRTMPLSSAAMASIEEHIDWFAVPLSQIYQFFSLNWFGVPDNHTSLINLDALEEFFPYIPPYELARYIAGLRASNSDNMDLYFNPSSGLLPTNCYATSTQLRLMELLGIPLKNVEVPTGQQADFYGQAFNPMFACAYQKIYMDYFRLSDRERNDVNSYNLDRFYNNTNGIQGEFINPLFRLRYRPWKKDFFTHVFVSPLWNRQDDLSGLGRYSAEVTDLFHQWLDTVSDFSTANPDRQNYHVDASPSNPLSQLVVQNSDAGDNAFGSVQSIRTAFAVNKFLEVTRRAGKHIDKQVLAHFGVDVPDTLSGEVIHLGHDSSRITIDPIFSTAETADAALGAMAGKGGNVHKSGKFHFTNNYDCPVILMAIYSAEPEMDYFPVGYDRLNTYVHINDFFMPAFDNLGMQPMFQYQAELTNDVNVNAGIIGWQYRWMESKLKYNKIHGALARSLKMWTTNRVFKYNNNQYANFLVSPFALNTIMEVNYSFDPGLAGNIECAYWNNGGDVFANDPLIHECYFDVKKASKMSAYGLEQL